MSIHPHAHQSVDAVVLDLTHRADQHLADAKALAAADPVTAAALRGCAYAIKLQLHEVRTAGVRMIAKANGLTT